ncbi:MAG: hypothetical protein WCF94_04470 [bacterium]
MKYASRALGGFLGEILEFEIKNKKYWFAVTYGGAKLSEYLHLACLFGSKKNILVGSCGGLNKQGESGDIIIPTSSFGDESFTRMYSKGRGNTFQAERKTSKSLYKIVLKGLKVWTGPVVTCQAMLAETIKDIKKWEKLGYLGVEMESSCFFAVSSYFKIPAAAMLYITDNLVVGQKVGDESHVNGKEKRLLSKKEIFRVAITELISKR